jgi:hypothetical protein
MKLQHDIILSPTIPQQININNLYFNYIKNKITSTINKLLPLQLKYLNKIKSVKYTISIRYCIKAKRIT